MSASEAAGAVYEVTTSDLVRAVDALCRPTRGQRHSLWERLSASTGRGARTGDSGASRSSRPPVTLSVVSLVMEVSGAAREGAEELVGHAERNTPTNLYLVHGALARSPDQDMVTWWWEALVDWVQRAHIVLGHTPNLARWIHGASCPSCHVTMTTGRVAGEQRQIPAVQLSWVDVGNDEYAIHTVHCRACGAAWTRGVDLDQLVGMILGWNTTAETLCTSSR